MEIDFAEVADNYSLLEQEEKVMIREAMSGPVREVIAKVFGAEFNNMLGQFATAEPAPKRGLAAR
tara:strand:+ start:229 stop:423 length:195 start_codon:yes stop_codon:yes gene_type:complete